MAWDLEDRVKRLRERASRGMTFGTAAVAEVLARLDGPQDRLTAVHIAGTNGKGSVVAFVESVARAAGLSVGAFVSPHLSRLSETIRIDGGPIEDGAFAQALQRALDAGPDLSLFETLTVAAFVALSEARVDLVLIEAGLGGLRDATNVMARPAVTALVHVDLDHVAELGPTVEAIAREKAGIARPEVPFIVGPMAASARQAARDEARRRGARPVVEVSFDDARDGQVFAAVDGDEVVVSLPRRGREVPHVVSVRPGLEGPHQAANAAVALSVVDQLSARFPGILPCAAEGIAGARWPGRLEYFEIKQIQVLLDGAHNASGAEALARALRARPSAPHARTTLVFGALADKDVAAMLAVLAPLADTIIYTTPRGRAACPLETLTRLARGLGEPSPTAAFQRALAASTAGDRVLVAGSLGLVGEVRELLVAGAAWDRVSFGAQGKAE